MVTTGRVAADWTSASASFSDVGGLAFAVASPAKTFCTGSALTGVVRVHVVIANATAGTVQLQASNSSGSGTVTIKANSDLVARKTG